MFCPTCGMEERNRTQFCRGCGAELRIVRAAVEQPEALAYANSAREDIARAVAAKIKQIDDADDLKEVVEDVLPKIEKFLESPEERRLRRLRAGMVTASIGVASTLLYLLFGKLLGDQNFLNSLALGGLITFFVGVALVINGLFFSLPKNGFSESSKEAVGQNGAVQTVLPASTLRIEKPALEPGSVASVIEHTTKHLPVEVAVPNAGQRNTRE